MTHHCTILQSHHVTHDVMRFIVERPDNFDFEPGQGVELAIDREGWREKARPFTPTSLPDEQVLEFIIKGYPEHKGVTEALHKLHAGDSLLMSDPFGTIRYNGPGVFIAAGAGITPFISILRMLERRHSLDGHALLFANKTAEDIICEKELRHLLGSQATFLCSREEDCHCQSGRLEKAQLQEYIDSFSQQFYLCGPPPFVEAARDMLTELGATTDSVTFEQ